MRRGPLWRSPPLLVTPLSPFPSSSPGLMPGAGARAHHRSCRRKVWEYACRAGTTTPFSFGEALPKNKANYQVGKTTPVGIFPANAWGLHDMHGNVWEWCQDWWGDYPRVEQVDPKGPSHGSLRVIRGGCWGNNPPLECRSAHRDKNVPTLRYYNLGCRLALVQPGQ